MCFASQAIQNLTNQVRRARPRIMAPRGAARARFGTTRSTALENFATHIKERLARSIAPRDIEGPPRAVGTTI
jgi:hypothetical protein